VPGASVHQIVTMASIIQREAARQDEMALISAVFWNRRAENAGERAVASSNQIRQCSAFWAPTQTGGLKLDNLTIYQINAVPAIQHACTKWAST
jgi:UPF0755 protein